MDVLIEDTVALTCDAQRNVFDHVSIAIVHGRIEAIGGNDLLKTQYPHLKRFDGRGLAVMPGLVNAHTHTVLMALRGTVEDWSGDSIYRYMTPISYAMTAQERAVVAQLGCVEAIRSGTTTL